MLPRHAARIALLTGAVLPLLAPSFAQAGEVSQRTEQSAREQSPKRQPLDYDGRPDEPRPNHPLLWAPRVVLYPAYLVSEYVVRRPVGALVVEAEKNAWPTAILDFFTFGEERKVGIIPTALIDFGLNPSVGLYVFADDVGAKGNDVRANLGFWGPDWLRVSVRNRTWLKEDQNVQVGGSWLRRPDYVYFGMGPRSSADHETRYGADKAEANLSYDLGLWRLSSLQASVGLRSMSFHKAQCCQEPDLSEGVASGFFPMPNGYAEGYQAAFHRLAFALDTRQADPYGGSGIRVEGYAEHAADLFTSDRPNHWLKYGGQAGGFVDVTGTHRVLSLWVTTMFSDALRDGNSVPFTESVTLGGSGPMRAYHEGRLVGDSAAVTTLQYEWPVWVWLKGAIQVAAGNTFGSHLDGFDLGLTRLSSTFGFRSTGSSDHYLEVLAGVGTETYEEGWAARSFRLTLGGNSGF